MHSPSLDYQQSSSSGKTRKFFLFFGEILFAGTVINAAPYWLVRSDYVTIGFPFEFYRAGGYVYRRTFDANYLIADVLLVLVFSSLFAWWLVSRRR